jgi:hypothetical protein
MAVGVCALGGGVTSVCAGHICWCSELLGISYMLPCCASRAGHPLALLVGWETTVVLIRGVGCMAGASLALACHYPIPTAPDLDRSCIWLLVPCTY